MAGFCLFFCPGHHSKTYPENVAPISQYLALILHQPMATGFSKIIRLCDDLFTLNRTVVQVAHHDLDKQTRWPGLEESGRVAKRKTIPQKGMRLALPPFVYIIKPAQA